MGIGSEDQIGGRRVGEGVGALLSEFRWAHWRRQWTAA